MCIWSFFFILCLPEQFNWDDYLKETESVAAPLHCFRQVCQILFCKCVYVFLLQGDPRKAFTFRLLADFPFDFFWSVVISSLQFWQLLATEVSSFLVSASSQILILSLKLHLWTVFSFKKRLVNVSVQKCFLHFSIILALPWF